MKLSSQVRSTIAVVACVFSGALGAIAIFQRWATVSSIAFDLACLWFLSGSWLAGDFTRTGWKRLNSSMTAIYREAKEGKLAKPPPLARVMNAGGLILAIVGIAGWWL